MTAYYMNEAAFELPEIGFVDRTVTVLETKAPGGGELSVVIQRNPLPVGRSLRDVVTEQLTKIARSLRAYSVMEERDIEIAGAPAIEVFARWRGDDGMLYTRQAHLSLGETWLVVAGNAPMEERDLCDKCVEQVIGTFRIRA
jgi:hypothetical protein